MEYKFAVIFLLSIVNFRIIKSYRNDLDEANALATNIWKVYQLSSIVFVSEYIHLRDLHAQMKLAAEIRKFSRKGIKSHAISFRDLERLKISVEDIVDGLYETDVLFAILADDERSLGKFQRICKDWRIRLSTWLLFSRKGLSIDFEKPQGNPFNLELSSVMIVKCENSSKIMKYNAIFQNVTEVTEFGTWTSDRNLIISKAAELSLEKINLKRLTLTLVQMNSSINMTINNLENFYSEFMKVLESIGNFTTKVTKSRNSKGIFNTTINKWTGVMSSLVYKEVDMTATFLTVSQSRMQVIDFSLPINILKNKFYLKLSNKFNIQWDSYFKVFNKNGWIAIGLTIILSTVLLMLTKRESINNMSTFINVFMYVWCIFCQEGFLDNPSYKSTQVLYVTIMLLSLILNIIYSASITSYFTNLTADLPFKSFIDFIKDESYEIISLQDTQQAADIMTDDDLLLPLRPRLKEFSKLPFNAIQAFDQVCNGHVAFYANEIEYNVVHENISCTVGELSISRITQVSLGLVKFSQYTRLINYYIILIRDYGIMHRLRNKYFYPYNPIPKTDAIVINFMEVIPILLILGIGIIAACIILILEIVHYRFNTHIKEERKMLRTRKKKFY